MTGKPPPTRRRRRRFIEWLPLAALGCVVLTCVPPFLLSPLAVVPVAAAITLTLTYLRLTEDP